MRTPLSLLAACAACGAAIFAASPASASPIAPLHAQTRRALLSLYAIDTQLHTVAHREASLAAHAERLRRDEATLALQLAATRHTLIASRRQLAEDLRVLYKQDDVSALAVVLGAASLDDAVTQLDSLGRVAAQTRSLLGVAHRARRRAARLAGSLHAEERSVAAGLAALARTRQTLLTARAGRVALLTHLRTMERVRRQELQALQQTARRVERKSDALQAAAPPAPALGPAAGGRTVTVTATGYSLAGHTSTGMPVGPGVVAVDPSVIPLGSRLAIPGYGDAVAADTGSGVRGAMIDLWFPTRAQARAWGRRTVTVTLH